MKVFNPTGWTRDIKVDSKDFKLGPFQTMEFYDEYFNIILTSDNYRNLGIVSLDYNDQERFKHKNFEVFKKTQAIKGLKALLSNLQRLRSYEYAAYDEAEKHKSNAESINSIVNRANPKKFDAEIKLVEKWLSVWENYQTPDYIESDNFVQKEEAKTVEQFDPASIGAVQYVPELNSKPRGVRKMKNESVIDSNQSA